MKKNALPFLLGALSMLLLGVVAKPTSPSSAERYHIRGTENVYVIDTWTGEVWRRFNNGDWQSQGKPVKK